MSEGLAVFVAATGMWSWQGLGGWGNGAGEGGECGWRVSSDYSLRLSH